MTCLVGIEHNGAVYLGADKMVSYGDRFGKLQESKIIKKKGFVLASCGSCRMLNILEHLFMPSPQEKNQSDEEYMCSTFVSEMRKCFTGNGFGVSQNDWTGGNILVAYNGKLYAIANDFSVLRKKEFTDGSGYAYAAGSLLSTTGCPKQRIKKAISVASKLCNSVGLGVDIVSMGKVKK